VSDPTPKSPPHNSGQLQSGDSATLCHPASRSWVLASAILGSSMAFIDGTVVNVALPALQSSLHATVVDMQWVVEGYGLFLSALILVGGALGDSFGRRSIFVYGTGLFAAASVGCGLASNVSELIVCRCVQGIGAAALVPSSLAIISASFDDKSRGRAIGTWSGFTSITTAFGPVLGGWLVEHVSWRWVFFINIPLAALVIGISLWHVPESRGAARRIDWLGASLATLGLGGLVFGFVESSMLGWRDGLVISSLAGGVGFLIFFILIEERVPEPMMPRRLFASRSFSGANLLTLMLYSGLGVFFFLFPMNLIQIQKYSATAAGAASLPAILLMFSLSRWSGGLVAKYGPRLPLIVGPLIVAAGFILFSAQSVGGSYWRTFFPAFVVLGLGMAVSVAPLTTVVMSSAEPGRSGTASGINNAVARVAGVLAVAILGNVMVGIFGHRLQTALARMDVPAGVLHEIQANLVKLGGLQVPSGLDADQAAAVQGALTEAFVFGFRCILLVCAALALTSAGLALKMIPPRTEAPNLPAA
jgi:EmrB/QacA subfamily drug resistance transporter